MTDATCVLTGQGWLNVAAMLDACTASSSAGRWDRLGTQRDGVGSSLVTTAFNEPPRQLQIPLATQGSIGKSRIILRPALQPRHRGIILYLLRPSPSFMTIIFGLLIGAALAAIITLFFGVYTIGPTERGIVSTFGRAQRLGRQMTADDPHLRALLSDEEADRYNYPVLRVIPPGGPYFKWPWQKIQKINMTIQPIDMAWDPEKPDQTTIECVTKDNLTIDVSGQIRWKPCERNLYPYAFGIAHPQVHVMGFFVSVLRDRIATFEKSREGEAVEGVSINDLRRNLSEINRYMEEACRRSEARYGIELDASLITTIDPPANVDDALASINTTHNNVAASISQARAEAEQRLKLAEQAVQIAENEAHAEAAPLLALAQTLTEIHAAGGRGALDTYVRNATLPLRARANQTVVQL